MRLLLRLYHAVGHFDDGERRSLGFVSVGAERAAALASYFAVESVEEGVIAVLRKGGVLVVHRIIVN